MYDRIFLIVLYENILYATRSESKAYSKWLEERESISDNVTLIVVILDKEEEGDCEDEYHHPDHFKKDYYLQ